MESWLESNQNCPVCRFFNNNHLNGIPNPPNSRLADSLIVHANDFDDNNLSQVWESSDPITDNANVDSRSFDSPSAYLGDSDKSSRELQDLSPNSKNSRLKSEGYSFK